MGRMEAKVMVYYCEGFTVRVMSECWYICTWWWKAVVRWEGWRWFVSEGGGYEVWRRRKG